MKYLFIILMFLGFSAYAQQDPLFNQYQFNQLPINPAYAGVNDATSFDLQYRSQWGGVEGAPATAMFSGHTSLNQNKVGVGFVLLSDQIGITTNTHFNLTYAYELEITNRLTLSFGLQTGLLSFQYDFDELNLEDQTDIDFIRADQGFTKFNIGSGLFLSSDRFYIGLSIPQLLEPTEDIGENSGERYNRHFYMTSGLVIDKIQAVKLKPYTIIRSAKNTSLSADVGVNALFADIIWGGFFTRNFKTLGISTFLNLDNGLRVGYSGELISNDLATGFNTHEISLGLDLELFSNQVVAKRNY